LTGIGNSACRQKVKKLSPDYKHIADHQKGTDNNRKQHELKYFDQLHLFLANRTAVRPPHFVYSSSLKDNTSGETEDSCVIDDDMPFADQSLMDGYHFLALLKWYVICDCRIIMYA